MSISQNNQSKIVSKSVDIIGNNVCKSSSDKKIRSIILDTMRELTSDDENREKITNILEECIKRVILDLNGNKMILAYLLSYNVDVVKNTLLNVFQYILSNYENDLKSTEDFSGVFIAKLNKVLNNPEILLQLEKIDIHQYDTKYHGVGEVIQDKRLRAYNSNQTDPVLIRGGGAAGGAEEVAEEVAEGGVKAIASSLGKEAEQIASGIGKKTGKEAAVGTSTLSGLQSKGDAETSKSLLTNFHGKYSKAINPVLDTTFGLGRSITGTSAGIMGNPIKGVNGDDEEDDEDHDISDFDYKDLITTLESALISEIEYKKSDFFDKLTSGIEYSVVKSRKQVIDTVVKNMDIGFKSIRQTLGDGLRSEGVSTVGNLFLYKLISYELDSLTTAITSVVDARHTKLKSTPKKFTYKMMNDPLFVLDVCRNMKDRIMRQFYREDDQAALAGNNKRKDGGRGMSLTRRKSQIRRKTKKVVKTKKRNSTLAKKKVSN